MRRRSYSEIQVKPPEGLDIDIPDLSALVPSYEHNSYEACSDRGPTKTTKIYYNSRYKYGSSENYHRDNYCMIPIYIPSMATSSKVYRLNDDTIVSKLPKPLKSFTVKYDKTYFSDSNNSIANIILSSEEPSNGSDDQYASFKNLLSSGRCSCDNDPGGSSNSESHSITPPTFMYDDYTSDMPSPIDIMDNYSDIITEEYVYLWEDVWDMETLVAVSPGWHRPEPSNSSSNSSSSSSSNSSSSSSSSSSPIDGIFIGVLTEAPNGGSGSAKVQRIKINSNGSWAKTGGSIQVICPILN